MLSRSSRVQQIRDEIQAVKKIDVMPNNESRAHLAELVQELQTVHLKELRTELATKMGEYEHRFSCCAQLLGCSGAPEFWRESIAPLQNEQSMMESVLANGTNKLARMEFQKKWYHGVFGVYNPKRGEIEWRTEWNKGVAGVWNPIQNIIEWKTYWDGGVAGVWNPTRLVVEWQTKWHHGVSGVWNPDVEVVEWKEKWDHGIVGIWNPNLRRVEWYEKWNKGIAAAWDIEAERITLCEQYNGGCGVVYWDGTKFKSTGSYCYDDDD